MESLTRKKHSLLIVDDNPQNLQAAASCLSQHVDCSFYFARTGEQALKTVSECLPTLILLDIMMPEMDGFEICRRLKADPQTRHIPVIFLTARVECCDVAKAFETGGADYVRKPFSGQELVSRVTHQLRMVDAQITISLKNRELQHLVQILCHDLSNPIASAHALLQMCLQDPAEFPEIGPEILFTLASSKKVIEMAHSVYAASNKNSLLPQQTLPLVSLLDDIHRIFRLSMEGKRLQWHQHVDEKLTVKVEPISFVHSVLANLVSNAIKFSYPGNAIFLRAQLSSNGMVRLDIEDHGIGMEESELLRIRSGEEPASHIGTQGEDGTGFGLLLVQKFVASYGGWLEIDSRPDEATPRGYCTKASLFLPAE